MVQVYFVEPVDTITFLILNQYDVTECAISPHDGEIDFATIGKDSWTNQQWTRGISHAVTQEGEKILERSTHLIER